MKEQNLLPDDLHRALAMIAGTRLAGNAFVMVDANGYTVWREARQKTRIWTPLANGRTLMPSIVDRLEQAGFIEKVYDGKMMLQQTDKRE